MIPLEFFYYIVQTLFIKPLVFWPASVQQEVTKEGKSAIQQLKDIFEKKKLTESSAYKVLLNIESAFLEDGMDEVLFIQSISNLLDVYKLSSAYEKHRDFLDKLSQLIAKASPRILEYYIGLELLEEKNKNMTQEDIDKSDMETIQQIGIFYILEYTVYILSIFPTLTEDQKKKLFYEGLQTKDANLPPYTDFSESFRKNLCLKILDLNLRNKLLKIFFAFEVIFSEGNLPKIYTGFKIFNIELLRLFQKKGIRNFKAVLLTPFGKSMPMEELIKKIEAIEIS